MKKLNPVAQKWVKALRSGKYKQGRNRLRKKDRFCCLGVLCELERPRAKEIQRWIDRWSRDHRVPEGI